MSFSPHGFRRNSVTDAIMNGLPPHIAQVICGHRSIDTTMAYKAVYPAETIGAPGRSSPAAAPLVPAESTESRPRRSGTLSSPTSRSGRCASAPARVLSGPLYP
ncbi:site-specific integrase [Streptomyces sp. NPDC092369]|uniref:site-specific integrase n=1 Tax=Streptomyces sp. NPDC092369 TaxID=3366015 RepID=UPI0038184859